MTDKTKLAHALVKPLVWERKYSNDWRGEIYKIDTAGYRRTIVPQNTIGGGFHLLASFDSDIKGDFPTLEAAKAAAEADYIARMAEALDLDAVAELVEVGTAYKEARMNVDDTPEFCAFVAALAKFTGEPE